MQEEVHRIRLLYMKRNVLLVYGFSRGDASVMSVYHTLRFTD